MSQALHELFKEATTQKKDQREAFMRILYLLSDVEKEEYSYLIGIALAAKKVGNDFFALNLLSLIYNEGDMKEAMNNPYLNKNVLNEQASKIVTSTGDVTQLLALQKNFYEERPVPAGMKKVLKRVLENASVYDLKNNLGKSRSVTLRDAIKMLHPKPQNAMTADLYVDIIRNRVKTGKMNISVSNVTKKYQEGVYTQQEMVDFIEQAPISKVLDLALELANLDLLSNRIVVHAIEEALLDEFKVSNENLQPSEPFMTLEFLSLIKYSETLEIIKDAVRETFNLATDNVKFPEGRNLILVDTSYGMLDQVPAGFHGMNAGQVAAMLGAIAFVNGRGIVRFFDDKVHTLKETTTDILEVYETIMDLEKLDGFSNFKNALGDILFNYNTYGTTYDNVIILTNRDNYNVSSQKFTISSNNMKHWRNRMGGTKDFRAPEGLSNDLCKEGIIKRIYVIDIAGNKEDFETVAHNSNYKVLLTSWFDNLDLLVNGYNKMDNGFDSRRLIEAFIE